MFSIKVWGDYAFFHNPKSPRLSHPALTPVAATGILAAIYWSPEFVWEVREIHVLKAIQYCRLPVIGAPKEPSVVVNDLLSSASGVVGLHNVAYAVYADMAMRPGSGRTPDKYLNRAARRVREQGFWTPPFFGRLDFAADFGPVAFADIPCSINMDIGLVPVLSGLLRPTSPSVSNQFFARLVAGVLRVPPELYPPPPPYESRRPVGLDLADAARQDARAESSGIGGLRP